MPDCYAVVGDPIAHSKSPLIHRLFAEQTGQDMVYEAIRIDRARPFAPAMGALVRQGYRGFNVTVPHKLAAHDLANTLTPRAQRAGAVNTLVVEADGSLTGDNTDGIGLVQDITELVGLPLTGRRLLILGAGGAVQGVLEPLLAERPAALHIANRTADKAQRLAEAFADLAGETALSAGGLDELKQLDTFDVIINGTAASLQGEALDLPIHLLAPDGLAYDMMYGKAPTPFLRWAERVQPAAERRDGLGMLVCQAAAAFEIWRGVRPNAETTLAQVRQKL